ncbi:50S ribosomal protein P1 [Archaeoglobales archaeon]|nr:MAG: 50S ribosomal protein P1 [Archaeoglobales archaeon]
MEYVYAALLLHSAGKDISEESVKAILEAAGVEVDNARVKALVAALDGIDIEEAISKAAITAPVAAAVPTEVAPAEAVEEKKEEEEEEEEEKKEEEAIEGLGALFG